MSTTVGYTVIKEPLKKYAIPLFIFCIYLAGVNIGITQWIAKNFSYHSSLGSMFFDGYYFPWMWSIKIEHNDDNVVYLAEYKEKKDG